MQNCCGKAPKFRNHSGIFCSPELLEQSKQVDKAANTTHSTTESFLEKGILFRRYAANRAKRHDENNRNFLDSLYKSKDRNVFLKFVKRSSKSRSQSDDLNQLFWKRTVIFTQTISKQRLVTNLMETHR